MSDLPTELLAERDRVRDVIVPEYESIGDAGKPALAFVIRPAIARADYALKKHDAAEMVVALKELRGIE